MVEPKNISEVIVIDSPEVYFVIEVMGSLNDVQELFGQFVVIFQSLHSSVDVVVVVILNNGVDLVLCFVSLPQVDELRVCHEKYIIVKKYLFHLELELRVGF